MSLRPPGRAIVLRQVVQGRQRVLPFPPEGQPAQASVSAERGPGGCKYSLENGTTNLTNRLN